MVPLLLVVAAFLIDAAIDVCAAEVSLDHGAVRLAK
jgi:hypothetical protein